MILQKKSRIRFENSPKCIAYEYPLNDKDLNVALVEINGRYPDKGEVTNQVVKELLYVVKGNGKVVIDGAEHKIESGDVVLLLPNQKYFYDGVLTLVVSCSPDWYPEQHKEII